MSAIFKLGIVGFGNMGKSIAMGAIMSGIIREEELVVCELDADKLSGLSSIVKTVNSVAELPQCEYVLFAVKPQGFFEAAKDYCQNATLISIMAGVKIDTLIDKTGAERICRVMPNTPCLIGKGMCALSFNNCDESNKKFLLELFSALGEVVVVDEKSMDAVTAVSGSGPAYVYYFINAMVNAGVEQGLDFCTAKKLALQTVEGAVQMIRDTNQPMDVLIKNVCSPGGTTIQAIKHFENNDFDKIVFIAMKKCAERSAELSEEIK